MSGYLYLSSVEIDLLIKEAMERRAENIIRHYDPFYVCVMAFPAGHIVVELSPDGRVVTGGVTRIAKERAESVMREYRHHCIINGQVSELIDIDEPVVHIMSVRQFKRPRCLCRYKDRRSKWKLKIGGV